MVVGLLFVTCTGSDEHSPESAAVAASLNTSSSFIPTLRDSSLDGGVEHSKPLQVGITLLRPVLNIIIQGVQFCGFSIHPLPGWGEL